MDLKLKEATILGMKGAAIKQRVVMMATSVGMIEKQIDMLEQTKNVLIAQWGQDVYDKKITDLMRRLVGAHQ